MLDAGVKSAVLRALKKNCPDATTALQHRNPFELLLATILSAQCTDKRVNMITPTLFAELPEAKDFVAAGIPKIESLIKTCGLYRSKAKNIAAACKMIIEDYGGGVPENLQDLQKLPGVGRKTANVVGSVAFNIPAIAVDTHVFRVSNRIGLAKAKTVEKTEEQLMKNIPKKDWSRAHHWIIHHGRSICHARKPDCENCFLTLWCAYHKKM
jgi:endonuclease III